MNSLNSNLTCPICKQSPNEIDYISDSAVSTPYPPKDKYMYITCNDGHSWWVWESNDS